MKLNPIIMLAALALVSCTRVETVSFQPGQRDYTADVRAALEANKGGNLVLSFAAGTYDFYPENAAKEYLCISNNDNGEKTIIFNIEGMKNVSVKAEGASFMFHGAVIPFAVTRSENVSLQGFSVDYDYPFTMEGTVVENDPVARTFTLRIHPDNPYEVVDGVFYFKGYDWTSVLGENIVFDPRTKNPYYYTSAYEHWPEKVFTAEDLGDGLVRFGNLWAKDVPPVGGVWVDKGRHSLNRYCPAIALTDSKGIEIRDVHIYRSGAMALIAQYSEDITIQNYSTSQMEGRDRMVTASADATHFTDCSGRIVLKDCRFESMLDDATNVHGTYMLVSDASGKAFTAKFGHFQQEGNHFADEGDMLNFVDKTSLRSLGQGRIISLVRESENCYHFTTDFDFSSVEDPGQVAVENVSRGVSSVEIRNCIVHHNRARSLLLSCPGKVLVEGCDFASMMAGIRICGDANYWFESGRTQNITIRGCQFTDLGIGGHSPQAILQVDPIIPKSARDTDWFFHNTINFENNTVRTFDRQIIYALSVENLNIRNNVFVDSKSYAPIYPLLSAIDVQYCGNVVMEGNDFSMWQPDASISIHNCLNVKNDCTSVPVVDNPNPYFFQN